MKQCVGRGIHETASSRLGLFCLSYTHLASLNEGFAVSRGGCCKMLL